MHVFAPTSQTKPLAQSDEVDAVGSTRAEGRFADVRSAVEGNGVLGRALRAGGGTVRRTDAGRGTDAAIATAHRAGPGADALTVAVAGAEAGVGGPAVAPQIDADGGERAFPGLERSAQEWHLSSHAVSQQTPSTQKPVEHSLALAQRVKPATVGCGSTTGAGSSAMASKAGPESVEGTSVSDMEASGAPPSVAVHLPVLVSQTPVVQSASMAHEVLQVVAPAQTSEPAHGVADP